MDKLQLTGQNLGRIFNFRSGYLHAATFLVSSVKLPNLQLKTRPKQHLGYLPLVIMLPGLVSFWNTFLSTGANERVPTSLADDNFKAPSDRNLTKTMVRRQIPPPLAAARHSSPIKPSHPTGKLNVKNKPFWIIEMILFHKN